MSKRPEVRNVQTPEGRKRRQNTFQQFSIAKKACFRKIPEADFSLIPLPMLETAIFRNLCATHTAIYAQLIQQSVHSSYSLSFTTPALPGS